LFFWITPGGTVKEPYEFLSRTGDGVCVVDGEQRIVLWSDAASRLLGFSPGEVLTRPCYEVLGGTDESGCAVCRRDCVTTRRVRRDEPVPVRDVQVRTRDAGRMWISVSTVAFPASWHELSVLAHLFRDADDRKQMESSCKRLLAEFSSASFTRAEARSGPTPPINGLTAREHQVLQLLSTGASTDTICVRLGIATTTTRAHVRSILSKLGVRDRLEAVTYSLRTGLIEIE
jgi:PAS domain S-box-containing protein